MHETFISKAPGLGESDAGSAITELYMCIVFGCLHTIDELGESWAVKIDLIEEGYIRSIELRGVDEGHKVL